MRNPKGDLGRHTQYESMDFQSRYGNQADAQRQEFYRWVFSLDIFKEYITWYK